MVLISNLSPLCAMISSALLSSFINFSSSFLSSCFFIPQ